MGKQFDVFKSWVYMTFRITEGKENLSKFGPLFHLQVHIGLYRMTSQTADASENLVKSNKMSRRIPRELHVIMLVTSKWRETFYNGFQNTKPTPILIFPNKSFCDH